MDGILLLDKPARWTSHDLVDAVRRKIGQKSVGHAGTLDPMATGLMILLLGKATKRSDEFMGFDKSYRGTIRLGVTTDSWDLDGKVLTQNPAPTISPERLQELFRELSGEQSFEPPVFSALKSGGRKAYERARKNEAVVMEPRRMRIDRFILEKFESPELFFDLDCSKGTYVRSLADQIGRRLGCGAVLSSLIRTRIGEFTLDQALAASDFQKITHEDLSRLIR